MELVLKTNALRSIGKSIIKVAQRRIGFLHIDDLEERVYDPRVAPKLFSEVLESDA